MNCRDMEELRGAYLDGELDLVRSVEVEQHARECVGCAGRMREAEGLRDAVRAAPYYGAPGELRDRVRRQWTPAPRRERWWVPALLTAAAILVAAWFWTRPSAPAIQHEVVEAHLRSMLANHLLDVPSTDRHTVKPWFAGKLNYAPEVTTPQGFELLGGRLDYIGGQPVAALVYRRRQHTINVFLWPSAGPERPAALRIERGFNVAHWVSGGMEWWAVSDLNGDELRELERRER